MKRTVFIFLMLLVLTSFMMSETSEAYPILPATSGDGSFFGLNNTDSEGITRQATADFSVSGLTLTIELTNTAEFTKVANQMLVGIFFDSGLPLGDPRMVEVTENSVLVPGDSDWLSTGYGDDVSGEFGFYTDADVRSMTASGESYSQYFISAASLDPEEGYIGPWEGLGHDNLVVPTMAWPKENSPPNGADFGLAGDDVGKSIEKNQVPYIQSSVTIDWQILGDDLINGNSNGAYASNVWFVYGTDFVPVTEPETMLLLGIGLIGLAGLGRKNLLKRK